VNGGILAAMAQSNGETVRVAFAAIHRGDYQAAADHFHADAEWHNTPIFPGERAVSGPPAIMEFWRALMEDFDAAGLEIERLAESGDRVVAEVHTWGQGSASGVPIDVRWGMCVRLRDDRVARVDIHGDYARALEAANLDA
jgi:ketosteroid isomerase-like protein